jgi:cell division protein FtsL
MTKNTETIATEVLQLLKKEYHKAIKRIYGVLIIVMIMFAISIIDSIYQRCRIINIIEKYEQECIQEMAEMHEE